MNRPACLVALALLLLPGAALAQEGKKWKPYQFTGNERYEYKVVLTEGEEKKETTYILDLRKKGEEEWEVTSSFRNSVKKTAPGAEILLGGMGISLSPGLFLMNPLFGAGEVKVTRKESVGGRSGFACELYTKQEDKEQLSWACTVDPALALPIRSITFDGGKEKYRMDLLSYKKD